MSWDIYQLLHAITFIQVRVYDLVSLPITNFYSLPRGLPPSAFTIHTCQSFVYKSDWYYTMGLPSHFIVELYQLQPCIFTTILIHHSHWRKLTATDILNRCGMNQQILLITLGSSNDDHLLQLKIDTTSSHLSLLSTRHVRYQTLDMAKLSMQRSIDRLDSKRYNMHKIGYYQRIVSSCTLEPWVAISARSLSLQTIHISLGSYLNLYQLNLW